MDYSNFLNNKRIITENCGFNCEPSNNYLFDFQKAIVKWSLKKGKAALFLDTGLGKTICQLSWADEVHKHENKPILIVAPLAVSMQTKKEGEKFGIQVNICRKHEDVTNGINITNYEMLDHFNPEEFVGIVLDESSILKSFSGKTTQSLIDKFSNTPYKLACTATPAPNDYQELGNHAEFLGIMTRTEMLATYFVHDGGDTAKWRIKGHAEDSFWEWVGSWASVVRNPQDLGFDGSKYILPKLNVQVHYVVTTKPKGRLLPKLVGDLSDRRDARKSSITERVLKCKELESSMDSCLIWCDYNDEGTTLNRYIDGSVEVAGRHDSGYKEDKLLGFSGGDFKTLICKPKIAGFGMNWQHCNNIIFCGLSDSYEMYYQAIRRCYRFGQKKDVNVHIVLSDKEIPVINNIKKKAQYADNMGDKMVKIATRVLADDIKATTRESDQYTVNYDMMLPKWEEMSDES